MKNTIVSANNNAKKLLDVDELPKGLNQLEDTNLNCLLKRTLPHAAVSPNLIKTLAPTQPVAPALPSIKSHLYSLCSPITIKPPSTNSCSSKIVVTSRDSTVHDIDYDPIHAIITSCMNYSDKNVEANQCHVEFTKFKCLNPMSKSINSPFKQPQIQPISTQNINFDNESTIVQSKHKLTVQNKSKGDCFEVLKRRAISLYVAEIGEYKVLHTTLSAVMQ